MGEVEQSSDLAVAADELWEEVGTLAGVNRELGPWLRMTAPRDLRGATLADLTPGRPAGRAWLLLGGLIPVDYDDLCIESLGARSFRERSRMLTMDPWRHERTIEEVGHAVVPDHRSPPVQPSPAAGTGAGSRSARGGDRRGAFPASPPPACEAVRPTEPAMRRVHE